MADFFIPVALFLLPYLVVKVSEGYTHNFTIAVLYCLAAFGLLYLILVFDNGIDPDEGTIGTRILAPFFVLSVPLAIATLGVVGWVRRLRT